VRKIAVASFFLFLLFAYGLTLTQHRFNIMKEELEPANASGFYDYRGETNVHTKQNLGSSSHQEIIAAAQEAGLDWLYFTDLNVFDRRFGIEGYHRQLLAMMGAEVSYLDSRVLWYDTLNRHSPETLGQAQVQLADALSQEGADAANDLLVLAHPFSPGYSWSGNYPPGLDGIEVVNLKRVWQRSWLESRASFIWSLLVYPFNAQLALTRLYEEPEDELRLWDQLNSGRRAFGFFGAEATATAISLGGARRARFPSYETSFSLASNHVLLRSELTGDAESDKKKITRALADGQFYFSLDVLGNPRGFSAYIQDRDKIVPMGSRIKWRPGLKIVSRLPRKPSVPFETAFLKDGQHVMSSNSLETEYVVQGPGSYRLVVRVFIKLTLVDGQRWMSWIYSNPFLVE
jgi:hypothetical protein